MIARPAPQPAEGVRYQTIEQRRAALHAALFKQPSDSRLRDHLVQLSTPRLIRGAAKDGIFISYARADELFAVELATDMRKARVAGWLDMLDVPLTADWHAEVGSALRRCGLMLAVVSPEGADDPALAEERRAFMKQGKIVLPVVYENDVRGVELYLPPVDFRFSYKLGLKTLLRLIVPLQDSAEAVRQTTLMQIVAGAAQH
jgi:hypothetical protein